MQLEVADARRVPVQAHLSYDADDPFAVTAAFSHEGRILALWRLDRQMLTEGALRPVGEGDVRMRPQRAGARNELRIELSGHAQDGDGRDRAVVLAPARAVVAFVERTYGVVAPGREEVCVDEFLADLMTRG
ncbi:SsgA family sporulation/cell division regulator [Streptomyces sp. CRN 30]|uniref:SsgA family sporulation/cell division regulator n=1 Tax=Streptomyces sp. CRN 30 TaxID=3075613 RepID=UPI0039C43E99